MVDFGVFVTCLSKGFGFAGWLGLTVAPGGGTGFIDSFGVFVKFSGEGFGFTSCFERVVDQCFTSLWAGDFVAIGSDIADFETDGGSLFLKIDFDSLSL